MTTASYGYPVVRATSVPGAGQKLRNPHFLIIVGVSLAVLVAAITLITVALKPTLQLCHFTCGPEVGPRLLAPTSFTSSERRIRARLSPRAAGSPKRSRSPLRQPQSTT
jgi:hypothetical protein